MRAPTAVKPLTSHSQFSRKEKYSFYTCGTIVEVVYKTKPLDWMNVSTDYASIFGGGAGRGEILVL